jgi:hypothetical protein
MPSTSLIFRSLAALERPAGADVYRFGLWE